MKTIVLSHKRISPPRCHSFMAQHVGKDVRAFGWKRTVVVELFFCSFPVRLKVLIINELPAQAKRPGKDVDEWI